MRTLLALGRRFPRVCSPVCTVMTTVRLLVSEQGNADGEDGSDGLH